MGSLEDILLQFCLSYFSLFYEIAETWPGDKFAKAVLALFACTLCLTDQMKRFYHHLGKNSYALQAFLTSQIMSMMNDA